jgi:hypothetical protein
VCVPKYFSRTIFPFFSKIKDFVLFESKKAYKLSIFEGHQFKAEGERVSQLFPVFGGK